MSFNQNHFWWNGKQWECIFRMTDERLYQIDIGLIDRGLKCNKIRHEINKRHRLRNNVDKDVLKINKCTNLPKRTVQSIEDIDKAVDDIYSAFGLIKVEDHKEINQEYVILEENLNYRFSKDKT